MAVIVRDVTFAYGRGGAKRQALNGVGLSAAEGSIYGLLGPSGCGKSTLLSCCLGVSEPNSGSVAVLGAAPGAVVPGYMPQSESLHSYFNSRELLRYYCQIFNVDQSEERCEELLRKLDLADGKGTADKRIDRLSGGQRRRLSLAAAVVHQPKIMFL